ncbi:MAG: DsbA family protein [Variovorax sp.]
MTLLRVDASPAMRLPLSRTKPAVFAPGFLAAFCAAFAVFTLLPWLLMRGAAGLQTEQPERFMDYVKAMYDAMWIDGRNMNNPATVGAALQAAGFDAAAVLALANAQATKDRLKATTQEAVERGVFGAPTMFVGDEMFWGQDRLDFVREALAA